MVCAPRLVNSKVWVSPPGDLCYDNCNLCPLGHNQLGMVIELMASWTSVTIVKESDFLATYWVPGAIGHSILRPENPFLTESQSSLGVPRPRAYTLSLLLLVLTDEFIENPPFWHRLDPISIPPPLENDPTPFTKNRR